MKKGTCEGIAIKLTKINRMLKSIRFIFVRYRIQVFIFGHTQIRLQHILFFKRCVEVNFDILE